MQSQMITVSMVRVLFSLADSKRNGLDRSRCFLLPFLRAPEPRVGHDRRERDHQSDDQGNSDHLVSN